MNLNWSKWSKNLLQICSKEAMMQNSRKLILSWVLWDNCCLQFLSRHLRCAFWRNGEIEAKLWPLGEVLCDPDYFTLMPGYFCLLFCRCVSDILAQLLLKELIIFVGRLAAARNVYGVTIGGIMGHAVCTGAAVLGGKQLASHINERMVAVCAIAYLWWC